MHLKQPLVSPMSTVGVADPPGTIVLHASTALMRLSVRPKQQSAAVQLHFWHQSFEVSLSAY